METLINGGLRELLPDTRDLKVGSLFSLPSLEELPESFVIGLPTVVNQRDSDFCAAASSCAVRELQEGTPLLYEWVFAVAKMLDGDINGFGTDLRTVCKVHQKYGAPERTDCDLSLENHDANFLRRIENWPNDLFEKAIKHQASSYFSVQGQYDGYDNIRATMWKFRNEKCGVLFGVMWGWALSQIVMETPTQGSGHALAQIGWTPKGMYIQNSYGVEAGESGRHYFSREVINSFVDKFGCFMFHDMPVETAKELMSKGIKYDEFSLTKLWITIKRLLNN